MKTRHFPSADDRWVHLWFQLISWPPRALWIETWNSLRRFFIDQHPSITALGSCSTKSYSRQSQNNFILVVNVNIYVKVLNTVWAELTSAATNIRLSQLHLCLSWHHYGLHAVWSTIQSGLNKDILTPTVHTINPRRRVFSCAYVVQYCL